MKYEITQEDKDVMLRDMQSDRTLKHLRNLSFYKFTIGDVLIREEKYHNYQADKSEWKVKMASDNLAYKYVYVFENDLGVGYIRRLSVNGRKFVETPLCVTQFDPDETRFSLDPEYADHMLLASEDEEFDTKSRYDEAKKKREQINRKNKKIAISIPDEAAALAWMATLKVGDQLWYGWSIGGIEEKPYFVHEIVLVEPPASPKPNSSPFSNFWNPPAPFQPYFTMSNAPPNTTPGNSKPYTSTMRANSLVRSYIFNQRPTFFKEVIS